MMKVAAFLFALIVGFIATYVVIAQRTTGKSSERPIVPQWVYINELEVTQGRDTYPVSDRWPAEFLKEMRNRVH